MTRLGQGDSDYWKKRSNCATDGQKRSAILERSL
jgi:hypothetical protein